MRGGRTDMFGLMPSASNSCRCGLHHLCSVFVETPAKYANCCLVIAFIKKLRISLNFVDFCHDSAKQASLMALAAPKIHSSFFTLHLFARGRVFFARGRVLRKRGRVFSKSRPLLEIMGRAGPQGLSSPPSAPWWPAAQAVATGGWNGREGTGLPASHDTT